MQKKLWICLISSKNLYLKYRFFLLFRRVSNKLQLGLKTHRELPPGSLIVSSSLSNLPEKFTMSEWFCRFFSLRLSKFTQTSCTFQARGAPTCDVPDEKPLQLVDPAHSQKRARMPRNSIRALVCLDGGEGRC